MAGVSITHLVIFIASLIVAAGVVGAAFAGVDQVTDAMEDRSMGASEELRTDVTIISDAGSANIYDAEEEEIRLLVKNTGANSLVVDPRIIDVLVNGEFVPAEEMNLSIIEQDGQNWHPGDVLEITIATDGLEPGDHRVVMYVRSDTETFEFRIAEGDT